MPAFYFIFCISSCVCMSVCYIHGLLTKMSSLGDLQPVCCQHDSLSYGCLAIVLCSSGHSHIYSCIVSLCNSLLKTKPANL